MPGPTQDEDPTRVGSLDPGSYISDGSIRAFALVETAVLGTLFALAELWAGVISRAFIGLTAAIQTLADGAVWAAGLPVRGWDSYIASAFDSSAATVSSFGLLGWVVGIVLLAAFVGWMFVVTGRVTTAAVGGSE